VCAEFKVKNFQEISAQISELFAVKKFKSEQKMKIDFR
jgi:hypothetical protein